MAPSCEIRLDADADTVLFSPRGLLFLQDTHVIQVPFMDDSSGFFAVYDGHGGKEAADLAKEELHKFLEVELAKQGSGACMPPCFETRPIACVHVGRRSCTVPRAGWRPSTTNSKRILVI